MKHSSKLNIAVITHPFYNSIVGETFLSNLIDILEPLSNELFVITGKFQDRSNKKTHIIRIKSDKRRELALIREIKYKQLGTTYNLIKVYKKVDVVIFYIGTGTYVLPVLTAKLLGKKTVLIVTGLSSKDTESNSKRLFGIGKIIFPFILKILENINFHLVNQLAVESEDAINRLGLNKYRKKISPFSSSPYINLDLFDVKKDLKDRRNLVGYIGRLSPEKGVLNFVKAIPLILKKRDDLDFLIGGGGPLLDEIKNELKNNGSYDKVEVTGWITHDELPKYLNGLKLIIAPSYTEGGVPAIIQEAMACGTIVLVTPVAGVDIIKDGETGFILKDNSPECIAKNVIRVLEYPELGEIINNAHNLAEEKYTYENTVRQYRNMLYRLQ